jgi:hypothetical protein
MSRRESIWRSEACSVSTPTSSWVCVPECTCTAVPGKGRCQMPAVGRTSARVPLPGGSGQNVPSPVRRELTPAIDGACRLPAKMQPFRRPAPLGGCGGRCRVWAPLRSAERRNGDMCQNMPAGDQAPRSRPRAAKGRAPDDPTERAVVRGGLATPPRRDERQRTYRASGPATVRRQAPEQRRWARQPSLMP